MMTIKNTKGLEKLIGIKHPVLIYVLKPNQSKEVFKMRILYPSGKCEYTFKPTDPCCRGKFNKSCFSSKSLSDTIFEMMRYDSPSWTDTPVKYTYKVVNL